MSEIKYANKSLELNLVDLISHQAYFSLVLAQQNIHFRTLAVKEAISYAEITKNSIL